MSYHVLPIDPTELAGQFSNEDFIEPLKQVSEEWKKEKLEEIKSVLERLPDRETDLVWLYYFKNKSQVDIAEIFNITQAAVSYRLKRASERIRFLLDMPPFDKNEVYDLIVGLMPSKLDAQIFREMYETSCQSEVADRLSISQGRVRHRFLKNLRHLGNLTMDRITAWLSHKDLTKEPFQTVHKDLTNLFETKEGLDESVFEDELLELIEGIQDIDSEHLVESDESFINFFSVYKTFVKIRYNFNILREVKLPKWSNRSKNTIV